MAFPGQKTFAFMAFIHVSIWDGSRNTESKCCVNNMQTDTMFLCHSTPSTCNHMGMVHIQTSAGDAKTMVRNNSFKRDMRRSSSGNFSYVLNLSLAQIPASPLWAPVLLGSPEEGVSEPLTTSNLILPNFEVRQVRIESLTPGNPRGKKATM